jgi:SAM-dependent MidA family methyltransferase
MGGARAGDRGSLAVVNSVESRLRRRIRDSGAIPFSGFMEEALYGEGGYYSRVRLPIGPGPECDFASAPSLSPLFGYCTARLLDRLDAASATKAVLLEAGAGNGEHLEAVLERGERPVLAWDRVGRPLPSGVHGLSELNAVPKASLTGLVFSCELFDALPAHRLIGRGDGEVGEVWVDLDTAGEFTWRRGDLSDPALLELLGGERLETDQLADLAPGWKALYRELASRLESGLIVTCDYGFERPSLLDRRVRRHGTLACYRRHRVHRNPFVHVGDQDLTASVDFTSLRKAGEEVGLETIGLFRLAEWLGALGIFDDLQVAGVETRHEAMALLDPQGLGHDLRVLVQARGAGMVEMARAMAPVRDRLRGSV